jgi:hypothetical protein
MESAQEYLQQAAMANSKQPKPSWSLAAYLRAAKKKPREVAGLKSGEN